MNLGWISGHRPTSPFDAIANGERKLILGIFSKVDKNYKPRPVADELTREHIVLLQLRYERDLGYKQIALVMHSTEDAVSQMHGRILGKIREQLELRNIYCKDHI